MNLSRSSLAVFAATAFAISGLQAQTTATTEPVGFVTVDITPGTGTAKKNTYFSVPLLGTEGMPSQGAAGTISGVTAATISNAAANWTAGGLSGAADPFLIQVTSGSAQGRMFQISTTVSNTADTVTIAAVDQQQVDLTTLGITNGDTFRIYPCDTLLSFFGTNSPTGIQGGSSASTADTITTIVNGSATTFYYNTDRTNWARVGPGTNNWGNTPLVPYYGIQYGRLSTNALSFVSTGAVPSIQRDVAIKNAGNTLLSQYWPVESTLSSIGLQNLPGWQKNSSSTNSDTVSLIAAGAPTTYWHNGTNWRRVGPGTNNYDSTIIPIGTAILINKKGSAAGYTALEQTVPYTP